MQTAICHYMKAGHPFSNLTLFVTQQTLYQYLKIQFFHGVIFLFDKYLQEFFVQCTKMIPFYFSGAPDVINGSSELKRKLSV